jgi:site-specific DNA-methyltransferase (adenine-specific)
MGQIILGDNLDVLPTLPAASARLIYIDPPFNTGKNSAPAANAGLSPDE